MNLQTNIRSQSFQIPTQAWRNLMAQTNSDLAVNITRRLGGRSVVFVGMMGCGKTAIGRITANQLDLPFFDADEEIENAAGMSVADFFTTYGEAEFRVGERKVIARLLEERQSVLALGGGAFLDESIRSNITQNAVSIWLCANLDVLYSRVRRRAGKRPLLDTDDPKKTLSDLLELRKPFYSKADIIVNSHFDSKNATRDNVVKALNDYIVSENFSD